MSSSLSFESLLKTGKHKPLLSLKSSSVQETLDAGFAFAKAKLAAGEVVCLVGDLGAGKTHFTKGIAQFLGFPSTDVQSPTFTLINVYEGELDLYHFDLYRLESLAEALETGIEEYIYGEGICVIEWPEKIPELLPSSFWLVDIRHLNLTSRSLDISHFSNEA